MVQAEAVGKVVEAREVVAAAVEATVVEVLVRAAVEGATAAMAETVEAMEAVVGPRACLLERAAVALAVGEWAAAAGVGGASVEVATEVAAGEEAPQAEGASATAATQEGAEARAAGLLAPAEAPQAAGMPVEAGMAAARKVAAVRAAAVQVAAAREGAVRVSESQEESMAETAAPPGSAKAHEAARSVEEAGVALVRVVVAEEVAQKAAERVA